MATVRFQKGKSGNPKGRPKRLAEARRIAIVEFGRALMNESQGMPLRERKKGDPAYTIEEILASKPYMEGVIARMKLNMAPHLEKFMWQHVFGMPKQTVEIKRPTESPMAAAMKEMQPEEIRVLAAAARRVIEARARLALPAAEGT